MLLVVIGRKSSNDPLNGSADKSHPFVRANGKLASLGDDLKVKEDVVDLAHGGFSLSDYHYGALIIKVKPYSV